MIACQTRKRTRAAGGRCIGNAGCEAGIAAGGRHGAGFGNRVHIRQPHRRSQGAANRDLRGSIKAAGNIEIER
ncbi:MAG: hypothetical protein LW855_07615 [Alphaproteobacteria bacterium]|nr:hypothetical protein [Alphaproteobacteria bacterium]